MFGHKDGKVEKNLNSIIEQLSSIRKKASANNVDETKHEIDLVINRLRLLISLSNDIHHLIDRYV